MKRVCHFCRLLTITAAFAACSTVIGYGGFYFVADSSHANHLHAGATAQYVTLADDDEEESVDGDSTNQSDDETLVAEAGAILNDEYALSTVATETTVVAYGAASMSLAGSGQWTFASGDEDEDVIVGSEVGQDNIGETGTIMGGDAANSYFGVIASDSHGAFYPCHISGSITANWSGDASKRRIRTEIYVDGVFLGSIVLNQAAGTITLTWPTGTMMGLDADAGVMTDSDTYDFDQDGDSYEITFSGIPTHVGAKIAIYSVSVNASEDTLGNDDEDDDNPTYIADLQEIEVTVNVGS